MINHRLGHLYSRYFGGKKDRIIRCGVVSETEYLSRKPRLCFFLKEANANDDGWSWPVAVREQIRKVELGNDFDNDWRPTAHTIGTWSYALHFGFKRYDTLKPMNATEGLKYVSMTNVKKQRGKPVSDRDEIRQMAKRDQRLWQRELEILNPELVICGGRDVYDSVTGVLALDQSRLCGAERDLDYSLWELNNHRVIILDFYHPAYVQYRDAAVLYESLEKAVNTLKRRHMLSP